MTGVALAIGVGFVVGLANFGNIETLANGQIVSRASPTIIDVVIAIAAGAAGAYGWSRPDVSNSRPGVGVAIALVPPLSVAGLSYSQGDFDSGNGALLLFVINAIATLITGATLFLLTGIAPLTRARNNERRIRTALAAVGVCATLIIGALLVSGKGVATNAFDQNVVADAVDDWIEPFEGHSIVCASISENLMSVVLTGPTLNTGPSADSLADDLSADLGRDITVDLRILLETRDVSGG
ncbi:MAG: putative membrane protein [Candidatus Aldehydirespiratoraceae bacterium]